MKITKDKLMNKVETLELVDKFQKTAQSMKGNLIYTITRANLMDMVELLNQMNHYIKLNMEANMETQVFVMINHMEEEHYLMINN